MQFEYKKKMGEQNNNRRKENLQTLQIDHTTNPIESTNNTLKIIFDRKPLPIIDAINKFITFLISGHMKLINFPKEHKTSRNVRHKKLTNILRKTKNKQLSQKTKLVKILFSYFC